MYSEKELFGFHEKKVRIKTTDGETLEGICWAYGSVQNESDLGVDEASLEIGDFVCFQSDIEKIEII